MTCKMRNIWIFGATGFIGSALVRHLAKSPANRLHLLIHKHQPFLNYESFNTITGSIENVDPFWFERYPPDVVFHLARPAGSNSFRRFVAARRGEKANRRIVKLFSALVQPPVIVYVSGSLVYGSQRLSFAKEDTELSPVSYAKYYFSNEKPLLKARSEGRLDVRFARPGWVTGPGSWFREFFWKYYLAEGKIPCYGDGSQKMSLIHLDDCAAMIDLVSQDATAGKDLNIFAGKPLLHLEFCEMLASLLNTGVDFISPKAVKRKFGSDTAEALLSSIPLDTSYPDIHKKADIIYMEHKKLLADVIRLLKHE